MKSCSKTKGGAYPTEVLIQISGEKTEKSARPFFRESLARRGEEKYVEDDFVEGIFSFLKLYFGEKENRGRSTLWKKDSISFLVSY